MDNRENISGPHRYVPVAVSAAFAVSVILFGQYERLTGDATLYLSIAEKYLRGDISNAINGYWGPLLSWLLIPFLYFGASHVLAINALNLLFGVVTTWGVWRLSFRFDMDEHIRSIVMISLVPVLFFVSLIQPMDFLLLSVLVFYLDIVFSRDYPEKVSSGAFAGMLGALAYFSKPYGLPFFLSHFALISFCQFMRDRSREHRRKVLRNALAGLVTFALLSGIWISLISIKYHRLTFSNMGRGVFASVGPGFAHDTLEKGDPIFFKGFFEPPNETAFVIYEDPSYARERSWSPLESKRSFRHFMSNLLENLFEGIRIYESYSRLSSAIIIAYLLIILSGSSRVVFSGTDLLYPLLTIALYTAGYFPFHFETRYLWIVNILLLLMGGRVLRELFQKDYFQRKSVRTVLTVFFLLSFIMTPIKSSSDVMSNNINSGMHALALELKGLYDIHGNIASNRERMRPPSFNSWHRTFRLAYWLNCRYYGIPEDGISENGLEQELMKYSIDFYFYWDDRGSPPAFLQGYREITGGEIDGLKIYSMKGKL